MTRPTTVETDATYQNDEKIASDLSTELDTATREADTLSGCPFVSSDDAWPRRQADRGTSTSFDANILDVGSSRTTEVLKTQTSSVSADGNVRNSETSSPTTDTPTDTQRRNTSTSAPLLTTSFNNFTSQLGTIKSQMDSDNRKLQFFASRQLVGRHRMRNGSESDVIDGSERDTESDGIVSTSDVFAGRRDEGSLATPPSSHDDSQHPMRPSGYQPGQLHDRNASPDRPNTGDSHGRQQQAVSTN